MVRVITNHFLNYKSLCPDAILYEPCLQLMLNNQTKFCDLLVN